MPPKTRQPVDGMSPAGPPSDGSSALTDAVHKLGDDRTDLVDAYNNCLEAVRIGSVHLFPSALATVQRILDEVRKIVEAALEAVRWIFEHYGPGLALHLQSFNWVRNVAEPMSGIRSDMTVNAQPNFVTWKGNAADYYRERIGEQQAAAKHVAANAQFIGDWLEKVLRENAAYVQCLVQLVVDLASALVKAAIEAGSGFGIPEAIETLKGEIDAILKVVGGYIAASGERLLDATANAHDVATKLAENDHLPGGAWPHAVTG